MEKQLLRPKYVAEQLNLSLSIVMQHLRRKDDDPKKKIFGVRILNREWRITEEELARLKRGE